MFGSVGGTGVPTVNERVSAFVTLPEVAVSISEKDWFAQAWGICGMRTRTLRISLFPMSTLLFGMMFPWSSRNSMDVTRSGGIAAVAFRIAALSWKVAGILMPVCSWNANAADAA